MGERVPMGVVHPPLHDARVVRAAAQYGGVGPHHRSARTVAVLTSSHHIIARLAPWRCSPRPATPEVLLRLGVELLLTAEGTEVIGLPPVRRLRRRLRGLHAHLADRVNRHAVASSA